VLLGLSAEGVLVLGEDKAILQRISLASVELWTGMNDGGVGEEAKGVPLATFSSIAGFFQITLKAQTAGKASLFGFATGGSGQIYQFGCSEGGTAASLMRAFTEQLLRELMEEEKDGAAAAAAAAAASKAAAVVEVVAGGAGEKEPEATTNASISSSSSGGGGAVAIASSAAPTLAPQATPSQ